MFWKISREDQLHDDDCRRMCLMSVCILLSTYHEAAPLLGVADAEHDDGDKDGAHGDPGHKWPGDDGPLHVSLPSGAV